MQNSGAGARAFQNARLQKKLMKQADAILSAAAGAYGQGRYAETEALCRDILKALPDHVDAMHLLGMCAHDGRRLEEARKRGQIPRSRDLNAAAVMLIAGLGLLGMGKGLGTQLAEVLRTVYVL